MISLIKFLEVIDNIKVSNEIDGKINLYFLTVMTGVLEINGFFIKATDCLLKKYKEKLNEKNRGYIKRTSSI